MMNKQHFQEISCIVGDDEVDTAKLRESAKAATNYIKSFSWCPPIKGMYLAHGVGGIVAVFFAEFPSRIYGTDDMLWLVVGDVPSAYLVVDQKRGRR